MARSALQKAAEVRFSDVFLTLLALNLLLVFVRDEYRLPLLGIASPGAPLVSRSVSTTAASE